MSSVKSKTEVMKIQLQGSAYVATLVRLADGAPGPGISPRPSERAPGRIWQETKVYPRSKGHEYGGQQYQSKGGESFKPLEEGGHFRVHQTV